MGATIALARWVVFPETTFESTLAEGQLPLFLRQGAPRPGCVALRVETPSSRARKVRPVILADVECAPFFVGRASATVHIAAFFQDQGD
ncbi:hypothetical protein BZL41_16820 [Pseudomonas sp. PIC25]|uniref:hypothetical protein n=1 Tax=Pseudomonas sp. PIC25 TaxID=1958773 RepID=UPI000BAB5952|nr:hypothetical protein [Pseudomonas sp. PIC25]PAU59542.1 hypothetical protein BZL41_16820 [Pseudomonas sp. PIC25]